MLTSKSIIDRGENTHHQVVGDQLSIIDKTLGRLAKFRALLNLTAKHIASGDMLQAVLLYQFVALRSLTGTRSTENYDILHIILFCYPLQSCKCLSVHGRIRRNPIRSPR